MDKNTTKIAVIGMGQGGMVAAIKLASAGAKVTIFEKNPEGEVGYTWRDDITASVFDGCGLPRPNMDVYIQKTNWLFVSPDEKGALRVPPLRPFVEISPNRRKLTEYFADLAKSAGAEIRYGVNVDKLVVVDDKVIGIEVDGDFARFDLVIDASGMYSKLREQLPEKFCVQKTPSEQDTMYAYRAFFEKNEGETFFPDVDNTMVLRHMDKDGIGWANLNEEGNVDVLLCNIARPLTDEEIEERLSDLRAMNPILSDRKISEKRVPLSVRAGIATPVADGYVALGDSAFMTIPIMGSGIEAGMHGGAIFADYVIAKDIQNFTAYNMWPFYVKYFKKFGVGFAFLDIVRRHALRFKAKYINYALSGKFVTDDTLKFIMLDDEDYRKPKYKFGMFSQILWKLIFHPGLNCAVLRMASEGLHAMNVSKRIPKEYSLAKIAKWSKKYNALIANCERKAAKRNKK